MSGAKIEEHPRTIARLAILATAVSLAFGVTFGTPAWASPKDPELAAALEQVLDGPATDGDVTAAAVADAIDGTVLFDHDGSRPMKPASNAKLLTAAAALDILGPEYRFRTDVLTESKPNSAGVLRGPLILKGFGDPTTLESDYLALAKRVKDQGITQVQGGIIADDSFFDDQPLNPFWDPADFAEYYSAQVSALTIAPTTDYDSGTVKIDYRAGRSGKPAKITITPASAAASLKITNRTKTTDQDSENTFEFSRRDGTNEIQLSGNVPSGDAGAEWVTVDKPQLIAGSVFAKALQAQGVRVDGQITEGIAPDQTRMIARDWSMPLAELSVPFMKLSNNLHAEHLVKTMGTLEGRRGNWPDGNARIREYLANNGVPVKGLRNVDGSGLAHANRVPPRTLLIALRKFRAEPWFDVFYSSLPVAGISDPWVGGTLRRRMVNTPAAGNLHGKTGSLNGVTALSGYVRGADGREYVFSMMSEFDRDADSPQPVEDEFGVTLAGWDPSSARSSR